MSYPPRHEARDASLAWIAFTAACVVVVMVFSFVVSVRLYHAPTLRQTSFAAGAAQHPDILDDVARVNADAAARLQGYGWVDRKAGIARIPIERAMALVAAGATPAPFPQPPKIPWSK